MSQAMSQPSWAAWIEIFSKNRVIRTIDRRSPLGLRGLKCLGILAGGAFTSSRSPLGLRGLKSYTDYGNGAMAGRRSPLGLRGLKFIVVSRYNAEYGRSPLGLRGLKYMAALLSVSLFLSQPSWAAWIEMALPRIVSSCL